MYKARTPKVQQLILQNRVNVLEFENHELKREKRSIKMLESENEALRRENHNTKAELRRLNRIITKLTRGEDAVPSRPDGRVPLPTLQNRMPTWPSAGNDDDEVAPIRKRSALPTLRPKKIPYMAKATYKPSAQHPDEKDMTYREQHVRTIFSSNFASNDIKVIPHLDILSSDVNLFRDIQRDRGNQKAVTHMYFVRMGGDGPHLGAPIRKAGWPYGVDAAPFNNKFSAKIAFEGSVLELRTNASSRPVIANSHNGLPANSRRRGMAPIVAQRPLPKYVHELGEVFIRSYDHKTNTQEPPRSTSCHLVVDVCCKVKALWLVYRYRGVENGSPRVTRKKLERDEDMFQFIAAAQTFDICLVANSMSDWLSHQDVFQLIHNAEGLIKKTHCRAEPEFVKPVYQEFVHEFYKDGPLGLPEQMYY